MTTPALLTAKAANELYGQQPNCKPYRNAHSLLDRMKRHGYTIYDFYGCQAVTPEDVIALAAEPVKPRVIKNEWTAARDEKLPAGMRKRNVLREMAKRYGVAK